MIIERKQSTISWKSDHDSDTMERDLTMIQTEFELNVRNVYTTMR